MFKQVYPDQRGGNLLLGNAHQPLGRLGEDCAVNRAGFGRRHVHSLALSTVTASPRPAVCVPPSEAGVCALPSLVPAGTDGTSAFL